MTSDKQDKSEFACHLSRFTCHGLSLSFSVRDLRGFGESAKFEHRVDAEGGTRGERGEGVAPADARDEHGDEVDRGERQQKADARLDRERGSQILRIA